VSELHPATKGFASSVEAYERGRPDYPAAAISRIVELLGLRPGRTLLDLAAGTGKLTRLLVPSGVDAVAVEPVAEMRAEFARRVPGVRALEGTAERIPLDDRAVDAVTVGQAFHWFDTDRALPEIHRVLRPGGGLAMMWNALDERDPLQQGITEIIDPLQGDAPRRQHRNWKQLLAERDDFERTQRLLFEHVQPLDEEGLVERVVSISFIAASPPDVRADVEARLRELARGAPGPLQLSYMTELYLGYAV
jgi:SAM-dependent methyltransferase